MAGAAHDRSGGTTPAVTALGTMRAIVQDAYGAAPEAVLRLAEIARPAIGDDEILVRIAAASVDRGTWRLMTGLRNAGRLDGPAAFAEIARLGGSRWSSSPPQSNRTLGSLRRRRPT